MYGVYSDVSSVLHEGSVCCAASMRCLSVLSCQLSRSKHSVDLDSPELSDIFTPSPVAVEGMDEIIIS